MSAVRSFKLRQMARAALLTAILAVLSQLSLPTPSAVPLTLQTFAVALCGACAGPLWGVASTVAYLLLGAVGVPVFSGFSGGVSALLSYTGGFLLAFPAFAALCGLGTRQKKKAGGILLALAGLAVCHLFGSLWYSFVSETPLIRGWLTVSLPYALKDALLTWGAFSVASLLKRRGIF